MGHMAHGLADEYPYYAGDAETGHDHCTGSEPSEPDGHPSCHGQVLLKSGPGAHRNTHAGPPASAKGVPTTERPGPRWF